MNTPSQRAKRLPGRLPGLVYIPVLMLLSATGARGGIIAEFNGAQIGGDEGLVTGGSRNYATTYTTVTGLDRDGDGNNDDSGIHVPWRSDLTPAGDYATTANGTHAGSAPIHGGYEWIRYNSNTAFSGQRFYVSDLTADANNQHDKSDYFNFRADYAGSGALSPDSGELAGVMILKATPGAAMGVGSVFTLRVHNRDTIADISGRWVVETDPVGNGDPADFLQYISSASFTYAASQVRTLTLAADTVFHRYYPGTALNFNQASPGPVVNPPFHKVVGVGFYFENDAVVANVSTRLQRITVRAFSVDAVAPPPKGTLISLR